VIVQGWIKVGVVGIRLIYVGILVDYVFLNMDIAMFLILYATEYGCLFVRRKTRRRISGYFGIPRSITRDRSGASYTTIIAVSMRNAR
jgi:hypothetical protein